MLFTPMNSAFEPTDFANPHMIVSFVTAGVLILSIAAVALIARKAARNSAWPVFIIVGILAAAFASVPASSSIMKANGVQTPSDVLTSNLEKAYPNFEVKAAVKATNGSATAKLIDDDMIFEVAVKEDPETFEPTLYSLVTDKPIELEK